MTNLYVVGGEQRIARPLSAGNQDWNGYQRGLIVRVSPRDGITELAHAYTSPPEVVGNADAAILFQAGTLVEDKLYICTQTEVMVYQVPEFEQIAYFSLPCFNDLHHVRPTPDGNLLIANAGLEMVLETTLTGEIRRVWNVLGEDPWARFSKDFDYRKVSTKPHRSHPNYLFYVDQEPWVTRFHQGDAMCLTDPEKRIQLSTERIHDGVAYKGVVYFTTVDAKIIIANPRTLRVEEVIDLNRIHNDGSVLGWCRSLYIEGDKIWVGFSRIRPTKFRENVSWVVRGFKKTYPTHIACYDMTNRTCLAEIDLEPAGLSAVYSIFPAM